MFRLGSGLHDFHNPVLMMVKVVEKNELGSVRCTGGFTAAGKKCRR